jgi:hypothetical protein
VAEQAVPDMDARRANDAIVSCAHGERAPHSIGLACSDCITSAIEAAVAQEREAAIKAERLAIYRRMRRTDGDGSDFGRVFMALADTHRDWCARTIKALRKRARGVGGKTEEGREMAHGEA